MPPQGVPVLGCSEMRDKLIQYLRGIADWSDPHPDLSRDMLMHEMGRIRRQALACIRMVESITEVNGDGGSCIDQAEATATDKSVDC